MGRGQLKPINPLPVIGHREGRLLEGAGGAPVALKCYRSGEVLLEARVAGEHVAAPARVEARTKERIVLSGPVGQDDKGELVARLALYPERDGHIVHLPRGSLAWHLVGEFDEEILELDTPELLIFPPEGDLSFAPRGLPVELLRQMVALHQSAALAASPPWTALVDQVFNNNPPRYDIVRGAPHFTDTGNWDRLTFYYRRYQAARNDPASLLNCYDAAAYLQILLRPTYPTRYCFMRPFGYLRKTNLIGRGECNNPFYNFTAPPVVPDASPSRTCFGNHAFCAPSLDGQEWIADACAGPHYRDTPADYVAGAVDSQVPNPPRCIAGTVSSISYYKGVANIENLVRVGAEMVELMTRIPESPFADNRSAFIRAIGDDLGVELADAVPGGVPDPSGHSQLEGWDQILDDLLIGFPETSRQWRYVRAEESVVVTYWVANDPFTARERFLLLGSAHQRGEPIFGPGPDGLGDVAAQSVDAAHQVIIWKQANIAFRVETSDSHLDLTALAIELATSADKGSAQAKQPDFRELSVSSAEVAVGDLFFLRIDAGDEAMADFALSSDRATFENQEGNEVAFRARAPGPLQISVAVADRGTLLSNQRTVSIMIVERSEPS